jgi:hypothetical protein
LAPAARGDVLYDGSSSPAAQGWLTLVPPFASETVMTDYDLIFTSASYALFASGGATPLLSGALRDYTVGDFIDPSRP